MSGLVGFFSLDVIEDKETLLHAMAEEITYVPEVHTDIWHDSYFGACRVHHGKINPEGQPVFNCDRTLCMFMEGEVFDYRESKKVLESRGYRFKYKDNDAEYCLHLYEEYGDGAFERLNGSFIIVIYDLVKKKVVIANDRFSSRKLFYFCDGKRLLFGSQVRALLKYSGIPRRLYMNAVFEFFTFQTVQGYRTFLKDVTILPHAQILEFGGKDLSLKYYWRPRFKSENKTKRYYTEKLAFTLRKAVSRRTDCDMRVGLLLSGGLDSRAVLAADSENRISDTFTIGDFYNREVSIASIIAETKKTRHVFIQRNDNYYIDNFEKAVDMADGMYAFNHAHFCGCLEQISRSCDILLHGYPIENFFRGIGFPRKKITFLGNEIELPLLDLKGGVHFADEIIEKKKFSLYKNNTRKIFNSRYRDELYDRVINGVRQSLIDAGDVSDNIYDILDYGFYFLRWTYELNRIHLRYYIDESTVAFDNDLLDLYLEMPPWIRADETVWIGATEILNKDISSIADSNTGLVLGTSGSVNFIKKLSSGLLRKTGLLKRETVENPAHSNGSWPNFAEMIRHNNTLSDIIQETINDPECISPDIFDIESINKLYSEHVSRSQNHRHILFLLLTFGKWFKKYGDADFLKY